MNEMIKAVQPPGKWKLLLVDGKGLRILNSTCKTIEILEENVTGKSPIIFVINVDSHRRVG